MRGFFFILLEHFYFLSAHSSSSSPSNVSDEHLSSSSSSEFPASRSETVWLFSRESSMRWGHVEPEYSWEPVSTGWTKPEYVSAFTTTVDYILKKSASSVLSQRCSRRCDWFC